ncbi:hypothetical protein ACIOMM_36595 [Streptomyces sp. NPDC087908]|uniref:hypothetical protein n=1 Tax=Streptomyces sp. NPDC087908 TaxID=3365820 RepID=UPI00380665E7
MTMDNPVRDRWAAREAPFGDFVLFSDGALSVMNLTRLLPAGRQNDGQIEDWHWSELLRATEWTSSDWGSLASNAASQACLGRRALCGEGLEHGSIGWVALVN